MSSSIERRRLLLGGAALGALPTTAFAQRGGDVLEIKTNETATIDGRQWDTPIVGGDTFDAVHRSVLLRFPTAGDEIADFLRLGRVLAKAELVMRYAGYEILPGGYTWRDGLGRKPWTENKPTWHVLAAPLRQPWAAAADTGPTFNASVNGMRYWARYGASDPQRDRAFDLLEPAELSYEQTEARIDITKLLSTPVVEREAGERLRALEQHGFLLRKLETYDARYRNMGDAYEWAMPIGGHGIKFEAPRLVLTTRPTGGSVSIVMPLQLQGDWQRRTKDNSLPTLVMPTPAEVEARAKRSLAIKGAPRSAWEQAHIADLLKVGGDQVSDWANVSGEKGYKDYRERLKLLLMRPPRYWEGWGVEDLLLVYLAFYDVLTEQAREHLRNYWTAWLQPTLATNSFVHPQSKEAIEYWNRTHDWRGNASFFRDGYNFAVSTQNFNHTAAMGALIGGATIKSEYAMGDGRHGLEHLALRFWGFQDGGTQELLDHYYLSITLSAQKMFADYGPTPIDRLMGRILVDRTMELLITLYHPKLKRFVSSSGRARISGALQEQDGIYSALHTLSKEGAVNALDIPAETRVHGMPLWGYDFPPGRVGVQSLPSSWGPAWLSGLIDNKPVPFEETATETTRGAFRPPLWRRTWLGRWNGLSSMDIKGGTIDLMAQWVRAPKKSTGVEDLGTLTLRYHANTPDLATTREGVYGPAGLMLTYQSRNRAIVVAKPFSNRDRLFRGIDKAPVSRLATVIGLWNFSPSPDWELFIDDRKITTFPVKMKYGQRLMIHDGVSYLALLPLSATDLGRDTEIEIGPGGSGKGDFFTAPIAPALIMSMYNLKLDKPVAQDALDLPRIMTATYGAFVLELGDAEQHGSFENFVAYMKKNEVTHAWNENEKRLDVTYRSGTDLMEASFGTNFSQPTEVHYGIDPGQQETAIKSRKLNGQWPYLPPGLDRDTSWSQQGTTGKLEKNGATLVTEAGRKAYLQADPLSGAVVGYNPLPDPQTWTLTTRDGVTLGADGKLALLKVEYRPWVHEIDISHVPKPEQNGADMARNFTIQGLAQAPRVTLNGKPATVVPDGKGFKISLG